MIVTENRQTFFRRIAIAFPHKKDVLDIRTAYMMAKYAHRYQLRWELGLDGERQRYFEHLRRSAIILLDEVGSRDRDLVIALLLHDTLEDTDEVDFDLIEHLFGERVAFIVQALSKVPPEGYVERLSHADWDVLIAKACDRLDNLRTLDCPGVKREFMARQARETREKYLPIFDLMVQRSPEAMARGSQLIRGLIIAMVERLDAALAVEL